MLESTTSDFTTAVTPRPRLRITAYRGNEDHRTQPDQLIFKILNVTNEAVNRRANRLSEYLEERENETRSNARVNN